MMYVPGEKHRAAYAVSRHPTGDPETVVLIDDVASISPTHVCDTLNLPAFIHINDCNTTRDDTPDDNALESTLYSSVVSSVSTLQCVTRDKVRIATSSDDNMLQLVKVIEASIPNTRNALPLPLREYYSFRDQLSTVDCAAIFRDQIVIPPSLRQDILTALHAVHQTWHLWHQELRPQCFGLESSSSGLETTATTVNAWLPLNVYRVLRFGPGSFRPGSFRPWVVSAKFGGSFLPDFFPSPPG